MDSLNRNQVFADILANDKYLDCHSQRRRMLKAFELLGTVTTFEFMRKLDIYDPTARKAELLKLGYDIICVKRKIQTESGEWHRVGHYTLKGLPVQEAA
jgi:hypothetical protein